MKLIYRGEANVVWFVVNWIAAFVIAGVLVAQGRNIEAGLEPSIDPYLTGFGMLALVVSVVALSLFTKWERHVQQQRLLTDIKRALTADQRTQT